MAASVAAQPQIVLAQVAPSQVTPRTLRPPAPAAPSIDLPSAPAPVQVPPGTENLSFIAGRVIVEGGFPEFEQETQTLIGNLEGRRVSVAQVYEAANALEQVYARAGYVLVRVTVPPQQLKDRGSLRIVVVDGFIERVQTDGVPAQVRSVVSEQMAPLVGQRRIKLSQIEKRLLIAGAVPGLRLKSALARGSQVGGVLLILEGTHQLVTGSLSVENRLPENLGTWSYGGALSVNSPLGLGEQLYVSGQSAGDLNKMFDPNVPLRVFGAGAVLPIGLDGFTLNPEYTYSRSNPRRGDFGLNTRGYFERFALRGSYAPLRTRSETLGFTAAFEYIRQRVALLDFDTNLNEDRYSVLRGGANYETAIGSLGTSLRLAGIYSRGLGGRNDNDVIASGIPLSRLDASPVFNKFNFDAYVTQPLFEGLRLDLIGRAQSSFNTALLASEQFSLDGQQSISAFPNGALSVDEGVTLRGELSRPFALSGISVPVVLSPYVFGAVGAGRIVSPTVLEVKNVRAQTYGLGLRTALEFPGGYRGLIASIEGGRQLSNAPDVPDGWRANVSVSLRF